jgi:hypothetical protein
MFCIPLTNILFLRINFMEDKWFEDISSDGTLPTKRK